MTSYARGLSLRSRRHGYCSLSTLSTRPERERESPETPQWRRVAQAGRTGQLALRTPHRRELLVDSIILRLLQAIEWAHRVLNGIQLGIAPAGSVAGCFKLRLGDGIKTAEHLTLITLHVLNVTDCFRV